MKSVCVILHAMYEDLGSLYPVLKNNHFDIEYVEASISNIDKIKNTNADLVVALGGPVSVNDASDFAWLNAEIELIQSRLKRQLPVLGLCLGAQLIAKACGAEVYPGHIKEIGWGEVNIVGAGHTHPIRLLSGIPLFHWHSETFDLPRGASLIASNEHYANQAFIFGNYCLGIQFHPELIQQQLERWLIGNVFELKQENISIEQFRQESERNVCILETKSLVFWSETLSYMNLL